MLKPGGIFLVTFSERWFPPKAIKLWGELHPFERMGLALDYFCRSGDFADLATESLRGLPRPPDDKYYRMTKLADPIYAVWGTARRTATDITRSLSAESVVLKKLSPSTLGRETVV